MHCLAQCLALSREGQDSRQCQRFWMAVCSVLSRRLAVMGQRFIGTWARHSISSRRRCDALRADREPRLDVPDPAVPFGFVEAGFMKQKTSYRNRSRVRLPVVADAFGLTGRGWARSWLEARGAVGLDAARDGFLLPTVFGTFPCCSAAGGRPPPKSRR